MTELGKDDLVLVTGAGGFIGGHLVGELRRLGYRRLRAVDVKPIDRWYQTSPDVDNRTLDLRDSEAGRQAAKDARGIYNLACDMGGMGFIETHKAECMISVLINTHMLLAARDAKTERYFYASSACVYAAAKQTRPDVAPLIEEDAYPAMPEDGYGWEKLYMERVCRHYTEDFGLDTRVVRFHNIFGPLGTYDGGREKSPAAICRKIALANDGDDIEVWGDGEQTRSYCYIDDCVEGIYRLMQSGHREPINLGQDRMISINELVDIVAKIAGKRIGKRYDITKPQGVRGRNSDNTRLREILKWEPKVSLEDGLARTYKWIAKELQGRGAAVTV
jgi:nucleoside-diphosphate-sugar epimerase